MCTYTPFFVGQLGKCSNTHALHKIFFVTLLHPIQGPRRNPEIFHGVRGGVADFLSNGKGWGDVVIYLSSPSKNSSWMLDVCLLLLLTSVASSLRFQTTQK